MLECLEKNKSTYPNIPINTRAYYFFIIFSVPILGLSEFIWWARTILLFIWKVKWTTELQNQAAYSI